MVSVDTGFQEETNICSGFNIKTSGRRLFFSKLLMIFWAIFLRYFAFSDLITPWFIGCVVDVVFVGKKNNLRLILNFRYDMCDNYLLRVPHFFLMIKIFGLIFAAIIQTVPYPSSFFFFFDVDIGKVKTYVLKAAWYSGFSNYKRWCLIPNSIHCCHASYANFA